MRSVSAWCVASAVARARTPGTRLHSYSSVPGEIRALYINYRKVNILGVLCRLSMMNKTTDGINNRDRDLYDLQRSLISHLRVWFDVRLGFAERMLIAPGEI